MKTKKKLRSLKSLKAELDRVFSIYVRRRGADDDGFNTCISCGNKAHWTKLQCGHYVSRRHLNTRWHKDNAWPQDARCNIFLRGNYPAYSSALIKRIGLERVEELQVIASWPSQKKRSDLEALLEHYKKEIDQLDNS